MKKRRTYDDAGKARTPEHYLRKPLRPSSKVPDVNGAISTARTVEIVPFSAPSWTATKGDVVSECLTLEERRRMRDSRIRKLVRGVVPPSPARTDELLETCLQYKMTNNITQGLRLYTTLGSRASRSLASQGSGLSLREHYTVSSRRHAT